MTDLQKRAAHAATAAERLWRLILVDSPEIDPVTEAYLQRLFNAADRINDDPGTGRVEPNSQYLGPLYHDPQTTASRYGDTRS
jgi:hypothetical protein